MSFAFNIGTIVGVGLMPYLATYLISKTNDLLVPGYLLMAAVLMALFALRTVSEPSKDFVTQ